MSTDRPEGRSKTKYMGTSQKKSCKTCTNLNKCHNTGLYGQNQQSSSLNVFADTQRQPPCWVYGSVPLMEAEPSSFCPTQPLLSPSAPKAC